MSTGKKTSVPNFSSFVRLIAAAGKAPFCTALSELAQSDEPLDRLSAKPAQFLQRDYPIVTMTPDAHRGLRKLEVRPQTSDLVLCPFAFASFFEVQCPGSAGSEGSNRESCQPNIMLAKLDP